MTDSAVAHMRFTPMCMGTTLSEIIGRIMDPVHPHVHGDNVCLESVAALADRFTPMCMGTTRSSELPTSTCWTVHPHVHGDNVFCTTSSAWASAVHPHVHGDNLP